jgi:hypothetical protein
MAMHLVAAASLGAVALLVAAPARADALRRTVAPMTRADGDVCDLLRAEARDRCKPVAQDGVATVYQSGSKASGIRRLVLAIDTGSDVLVSPPIDVIADQLAVARPTLRALTIDGRPGVMLDVVATSKPATRAARGGAVDRGAADRRESLIGCVQSAAIWKCSVIEVGACDASVAADGVVTTSCGTSSTLSLAPGA